MPPLVLTNILQIARLEWDRSLQLYFEPLLTRLATGADTIIVDEATTSQSLLERHVIKGMRHLDPVIRMNQGLDLL